MAGKPPELRSQMHQTYVDTYVRTGEVDLRAISRLFNVSLTTAKKWADEEEWHEHAVLARANLTHSHRSNWILRPIIREVILDWLNGAGIQAMIREEAVAMAEDLIRERLDPLQQLVEKQTETLTAMQELVERSLKLAVDAIPTSAEAALLDGWGPKEIVSVAKLAVDLHKHVAATAREISGLHQDPTTPLLRKDDLIDDAALLKMIEGSDSVIEAEFSGNETADAEDSSLATEGW